MQFPNLTIEGFTMTLQQKRLIAQAYQSAWFAYSFQAISVSIDTNGFFVVKTDVANTLFLPEWLRAMSASTLLHSLATLTTNLAAKREVTDLCFQHRLSRHTLA